MSESEEQIQRVQSSFGDPLESHVSFDLHTVQFRPQIQPFSSNSNAENTTKRVGIPPLSPGSQIIPATWSFSQPLFFSGDSLPPLSPSSYRGQNSSPAAASDQVVGDANGNGNANASRSLMTHRRSNSDVPFGFSTILQSSPPLIPLRKNVKQELNWEKTGSECNVDGSGGGERRSEGEVVDDWFSSYVNLNNLGKLNSFRTENREDLDTSDNEATSSVIGSSNNMQRSDVCSISDKKEGVKRSADGHIALTTRHYRSVSMDSVMGKINFIDESLKLLPSPRGQVGKLLSTGSPVANADAFSLEIGNGVFNGAELKKIMGSETLAEMALTDPKRVKRILANRQSAARSKERKTRYIAELENKVQTLQTEATTLSAQVTLLQGNLTSLTSQNSELKFRVQAMEQQAHLRDALNDTLTAEVQRLKIMRMDLSADATNFSQLSINPHLFQLHNQREEHKLEQNGDTIVHE